MTWMRCNRTVKATFFDEQPKVEVIFRVVDVHIFREKHDGGSQVVRVAARFVVRRSGHFLRDPEVH